MLSMVYLGAVLLAHLSVVLIGPSVTIVNAFVWIGLDLTLRDRLHEHWHGRRGGWRMAGLITTGALLSWALNQDAAPIAWASCIAFACAGGADVLGYHLLRHHPWSLNVNGSNVLGAAVDSLIFPTLAFGALLPTVIVGQFITKVLGGGFWCLMLRRRVIRRAQR